MCSPAFTDEIRFAHPDHTIAGFDDAAKSLICEMWTGYIKKTIIHIYSALRWTAHVMLFLASRVCY